MWIQLPDGHSATALAETARRAGVDVLPGPTFSCHDDLDGFLRISFTLPADALVAGVTRLATAWTAINEQSSRRFVVSR